MTLTECPKCRGSLRVDSVLEEVDLQCVQCGRGWKEQSDGTWHSRWVAIVEVVDANGQNIRWLEYP